MKHHTRWLAGQSGVYGQHPLVPAFVCTVG